MGARLNNELPTPPMAADPKAMEVLRVWAGPELPQQVVLQTTWTEPEAWGLVLADAARHVAKAYAAEGISEAAALVRIAQLFNAELASPTDTPTRI